MSNGAPANMSPYPPGYTPPSNDADPNEADEPNPGFCGTSNYPGKYKPPATPPEEDCGCQSGCGCAPSAPESNGPPQLPKCPSCHTIA